MIYTCISSNQETLKKQYSIMSTIISSMDEFLQTVLKDDIEFYIIDVEFIDTVLTWEFFEVFIENYRKTHNTTIIMIGNNPKIIPKDINYIEDDLHNFEVIKEQIYSVVQLPRTMTPESADKAFIKEVHARSKVAADNSMIFSSFLVANRNKICRLLEKYTSEEIKQNDEMMQLSSSLQTIRNTNEDLLAQIKELKEANEILQQNFNRSEANLKSVKAAIYQKNNLRFPDFEPLKDNSNKLIIYFKEITKVTYFDSFVRVLARVLTAREFNVGIHIFEKEYAYSHKKIYEKHYASTDNLSISDLDKNTITIGYDRQILTSILSFSPNQILIIVDKTGHDFDLVESNNIRKYYIMSDLEDNIYDKPEDTIISYSSKTMSIPTIKDYEKLSSYNAYSMYTQLPILRSILDDIFNENSREAV